jgi:hypothetical protein
VFIKSPQKRIVYQLYDVKEAAKVPKVAVEKNEESGTPIPDSCLKGGEKRDFTFRYFIIRPHPHLFPYANSTLGLRNPYAVMLSRKPG